MQAVEPKPVKLLVGSDFITVDKAKSLGVRRISTGGALARAAWGGFLRAAREIATRGTFAELANGATWDELESAFKPD